LQNLRVLSSDRKAEYVKNWKIGVFIKKNSWFVEREPRQIAANSAVNRVTIKEKSYRNCKLDLNTYISGKILNKYNIQVEVERVYEQRELALSG
jgi:hypothetical protein